MNNIVNIEDKAFMAVLLSAVEAFSSRYSGDRRPNGSTPEGEVHGLLFGQRIIRDAETTVNNVTLAVPNQIVLERTGDGVSVSTVHIDRIREVTELFPIYSLLAFFHSHPWPKDKFHKVNCVEPPDMDKKNAVGVAEAEFDDMLDLIIGITRLKRRSTVVPESLNPNMIHTCCGNYKYTLSCNIALAPEEDEDSAEEVEERYLPADNLICTTASGIVYMDLGR